MCSSYISNQSAYIYRYILFRDVCTNGSFSNGIDNSNLRISNKYECENGQLYHLWFSNTACNGNPQQKQEIDTDATVICDGISNCPYAVIRSYQSSTTECDNGGGWIDMAFIVDQCQTISNNATSMLYTCDDNVGLTQIVYDTDDCDNDPINQTVIRPINECVSNEEGINSRFIQCGTQRHNTSYTNDTTSSTTSTTQSPSGQADDVWFITAIVFIVCFGVLLLGMCALAARIQPEPKYRRAPEHPEIETGQIN